VSFVISIILLDRDGNTPICPPELPVRRAPRHHKKAAGTIERVLTIKPARELSTEFLQKFEIERRDWSEA
jgi:hypothetical protein